MSVSFSRMRKKIHKPHVESRLAAPSSEIDAGQHNFRIAAAEGSDLLDDSAARGRYGFCPRTYGMMQNEHRFPQPS